ncbi:PadR family transcriptional regulator [Billgrantia montanilacus]|uniref:PadR family transcriptional regulator n=1 Tax=Billgrantia montanilacus TaxID=2282305 RepID=A0A368U0M7_9GAMM|nr:PadR family transcriptional regulator [Halomonas montanilacus]RCV90156.1 PadR family transcriptional regulator [Halomonas montanilacus]
MTQAKTESATGRKIPDYSEPSYWHGTIKMSLSKFFVLSVLHRKPMHGYEVVQAVEKSTKGCCSPSEGTVYPMLNEFEAGGYLSSSAEVVQGRTRKVYALTEKGREAFQVAVDAWLEATDCILESRRMAGGANSDREGRET